MIVDLPSDTGSFQTWKVTVHFITCRGREVYYLTYAMASGRTISIEQHPTPQVRQMRKRYSLRSSRCPLMMAG